MDDAAADAAEKRAARVWWDAARQQQEEAYLLANVLPSRGSSYPDLTQIRLLARKYPRRLPRFYRDALESHPDINSWPLAEAIGTSSLTREEKVELFVLAAAVVLMVVSTVALARDEAAGMEALGRRRSKATAQPLASSER